MRFAAAATDNGAASALYSLSFTTGISIHPFSIPGCLPGRPRFPVSVLLVLLVGGWIGQGVSGSSEVGVSIYYGSVYAMYAAMLLWVIDYFILWRGLKKKLIAKFGEVQRGGGMYTFNRVMMVRRWRRPVPMVKYGEYPH